MGRRSRARRTSISLTSLFQAVLVSTVLLGASSAIAQQRREPAAHIAAPLTPRNELSTGYRHIEPNDSGGGFSLNGVYLSSARHISPWLSVVGETSASRAANIGGTGDTFKLTTMLAGPRITVSANRFEFFGQALLGIAHGSETYAGNASAFSTGSTTHAIQPGGGADLRLNRQFSLRMIDVELLQTSFASGTTTSQKHLTLGSGLVWKFHGYVARVVALQPPDDLGEIFFTCGTDTPTVVEGQPVEILGHARTMPDPVDLDFFWKPSGGAVVGSGRQVLLDTTGMLPGEYHVHGRAALVSSPATTKDCELSFRVVAGSATTKVVEIIH